MVFINKVMEQIILLLIHVKLEDVGRNLINYFFFGPDKSKVILYVLFGRHYQKIIYVIVYIRPSSINLTNGLL